MSFSRFGILATAVGIVFSFGAPVFAQVCENGMVPASKDLIDLNPELAGRCVTPQDLAQLKPLSDSLKYLETKVCPGKQVGYNSSINPSQLKEQYVYFSYPNPSSTNGDTSMTVSAYTCFADAIKAMESAGLQPCIVAALRSPQHQEASCRDTSNTIVCGRVAGSTSCSGNYGSCPHVTGRAMDFNDRTSCNGGSCGISADFANRMRTAAAKAGAIATVSSDLPHLECRGSGTVTNLPNNGVVGPQISTVGPGGMAPQQNTGMGLNNILGLGMLGASLANFFSPPQPQQCPQGYIMMNGACLPPQAMQQQINPFANTTPPPTPSPSPTSSNINTGSNTNTGTKTNTNVDLSDLSGSSDILKDVSGSINTDVAKKKGTTTSIIDLLYAIAYGTSSPGQETTTATGTLIKLNGTLGEAVALHGTPIAVNNTVTASSTYALTPVVSQTFISQDLSKAPTTDYGVSNSNSTFAILDNLKQILLGILQKLKPFGGTVPTGVVQPGNSVTAVLR